MTKSQKYTSLFLALLLASPAMAKSTDTFNLAESVEPYTKVRTRVESVSNDQNATAITNKTVLGAKLSKILSQEGLNAQLEFNHVSVLDDRYNSSSASKGYDANYSTVIDPALTRVSQAFLSYKMGDNQVSYGTKILNLDNQRFIGSVGWRQTPQTFGLADITNTSIENLKLYGAYVFRRNGIKDELSQTYTKGSWLLNSKYKLSKDLSLRAYGYLIEDTHNTIGAAVDGKVSVGQKVKYSAEYAVQSDPGVTDSFSGNVDSYYYNVEAGTKVSGAKIKVGYSVFGEAKGSATTGFSTPLATLHGFEGWSDVMLSSASAGSANGFSDLSFGVTVPVKKIGKFGIIYHKFNSAINNMDYGSEIDLVYTKCIAKNLTARLKGAMFTTASDISTVDTQKYWAELNWQL